jgi:hypothetical protein
MCYPYGSEHSTYMCSVCKQWVLSCRFRQPRISGGEKCRYLECAVLLSAVLSKVYCISHLFPLNQTFVSGVTERGLLFVSCSCWLGLVFLCTLVLPSTYCYITHPHSSPTHTSLKMEVACSCKTMIYCHKSTWCNNVKDHNLKHVWIVCASESCMEYG